MCDRLKPSAKRYKDATEENLPHRKIDAVVSLLCALKAAGEYAVAETRSTARYTPL